MQYYQLNGIIIPMNKGDVLALASELYEDDQVTELTLAIDYATEKHEGQLRKSGKPYITHPLAVAHTLITWDMDIDSVIAGVLHDTVEDTGTKLEEIENLFGHDVAFLVDGVTKIGQARAGMRDLTSYMPQTKDNLSKLLIAVSQDVRVIIIKLADRLHNMQTLGSMPPAKQKKIARETLEVFAPLADRLGMGRVRMELEELAFSYLDPEEYVKLKNLIKKRLGRSTRKLGSVRTEVEKELKKHNIQFEINGRVKSIYSLHRKLQKVGDIENIYDLMALRIIVPSKESCYQVLGILHSMYQPMVARIKDYIAIPKPNGYQSLHTTVLTPSKQIVEFQIRTQEMHDWAERGLAAGFHYNEQKGTKSYTRSKNAALLPTELQWITQMQEVAERLRDGEEISRDQLNIDLFGSRIFVYSPKGDIYNLPEGALPLDFAYLVHSDIAKHAYSFNVNGKIHAFDKPLQNGDVVEVITRKLSQPKNDWTELVTTSHARTKLRMQLRKLGLIEAVSGAAAIIRDKAVRRRKPSDK